MPRPKSFKIEWALEKALELFWERGYYGTTMQVVADHLKVSRSAVYNTFGNKQELFAQALQRYGVAKLSGLQELSGAGSPRAALLRVFEAIGAGGERQPLSALSLLSESALWVKHREPEIARIVKEAVADLEACFREAVVRGRAAAEIADRVDPDTVAQVLLALYFCLHALVRSEAGELVQKSVLDQVQALLPAPGA